MKLNGFEMFALMVCSCLFGIIVSIYNMSNLITDREVTLVCWLFMVAAVSFWAQQHAKQDLIQYLSHHKSEIEERQIMDLQVAHRRQVLALKSEHSNEIRQLNGNIRTVNAKFDRLDGEYNWMSDTYQEQTRLVHEQEDRIAYLEGKLHEFGQTTPNTRQPFSAPPSQIRFNNPPRRTRYDSAAGASSPLANVIEVGEVEDQ